MTFEYFIDGVGSERKRGYKMICEKVIIPHDTLESMKQFFLKTSVPRIIKKEREKKE